MVIALKLSKDLNNISLEELVSSLRSHKIKLEEDGPKSDTKLVDLKSSRRLKLFKLKLMKSLKRNQKMMNCLFCPDVLINSRRKCKANSEDKEGHVVVLIALLDPRRLELEKNSGALSDRSLATSRMSQVKERNAKEELQMKEERSNGYMGRFRVFRR